MRRRVAARFGARAAALQYFDRHAAYFRKMAETGAFTVLETGEDLEKLSNKQGTAFILTVEGGSAVAGDLKNIHHLRENGVRVMTLTWNGSNEIGSGVMSGDKFGLTPFGKLAVKEMEKEGIVIDISHASEALFYDVAGNTERPFIATHSTPRCSASTREPHGRPVPHHLQPRRPCGSQLFQSILERCPGKGGH